MTEFPADSAEHPGSISALASAEHLAPYSPLYHSLQRPTILLSVLIALFVLCWQASSNRCDNCVVNCSFLAASIASNVDV